MPYLKETFVNREVRSTYSGPPSQEVLSVQDSAEVLSFRTRKHPLALTSVTVQDISADPYAYFLTSSSERAYQARLAERGMPAEGSPDKGHAFELKKHIVVGQMHSPTRVYTAGPTASYTNVFVAPYLTSPRTLESVHGGSIIQPAPYKEVGLDAYAQQAYNKVAPTSVVFDAAQFLGELREGLPRLTVSAFASKAGFFRGLGSDYLNVEFGWKPFIKDIQNAATSLYQATRLLSQHGTRVHRRIGRPPVTAADVLNFSSQSVGIYGGGTGFATGRTPSAFSTADGESTGSVTKTASSRRWFEGEFSSFMPLGFDPNNFFDRYNALVNLKITPETLWQLTPWSWLVDWFLNIDDTIAANQKAANDLLIMHYGYAMESTVYTTEVSWRLTKKPGAASYTYSNFPEKGRYLASTMYKRRLRANPYGFKVGGGGALSGSQFAILGALGLTKAR